MASKYDIQGIACARSGGYNQRDKETKRQRDKEINEIYFANDIHRKRYTQKKKM
jgi:hypothetical protein